MSGLQLLSFISFLFVISLFLRKKDTSKIFIPNFSTFQPASIYSEMINVSIEHGELKEEITKAAVLNKLDYRIHITNKFPQAIKWLTVEYGVMFEERNAETVYYSSSSSDYLNIKSSGAKYKLAVEEEILPETTTTTDSYILTFNENSRMKDLQDTFKEMYIYKYFGELADGTKFSHIARPELTFNGDNYSNSESVKTSLCFITTVAFGEPCHPMVREFRYLRDNILVNFSLGCRFIESYAQWGPVAAAKIAPHPMWKAMLRAALLPLALTIRTFRCLFGKKL